MSYIFISLFRYYINIIVIVKDAYGTYYLHIAPSTGNTSPKDSKNQRAPYEEALIGIKPDDPSWPLEVLKVPHSDPSLAYAAHTIDVKRILNLLN